MLFSTPFIAFSTVLSLVYIFLAHREKQTGAIRLPNYPEPERRDKLYLVLGEVHHAKKPEPVENPRWLVIPDRGLFTGIAIFGAIGTGKTTGCMYPFAKQLLSFRSLDKERRVGGLILEVKGDFVYHVKRILEDAGRGEDYVEISLDTPYRYNPLNNDLDAYALAYGIASLLNNLFGMADDKVRKIAEEALNRLATELDAGKSDALQNYLATMGRFHRYSWGNVLLIGSQRPTATRVAGYHAWKDLGRQVKTGEKGIMILAPIKVRQRQNTPPLPNPDHTATKKDDALQPVGFRTAFVFDVEQTEGKPLPEFAKTTGDPKDYLEKLKALVTKQGISLEYDKSIAPAQGVSSGGKIRLMPGMEPAEEFSVLAHELAHEMLHHSKQQDRLPKTKEETQAEAVAYVVSRGVGLETNSAAADYIALYKGDNKTLAESLSVIQETSSRILDELMPQQRPTPHHEKRPEKTSTNQPPQSQEEPRSPNDTEALPAPQMPDLSDSISMDR